MPELASLLALLAVPLLVSSQTIDSYAPLLTTCPSNDQLLRLTGSVSSGNQTLSTAEQAYISSRKGVAVSAWQSFLGNRSIGYDLSTFNNASTIPTLGIAMSGGGYRASQYGAGVINAFDGRNSTSVSAGTGGVLQMASYITGLSGGSWVLGSWAIWGAPSIYDLVLGNDTMPGWLLENNLLLPGGVLHPFDDNDFYDNLGDDTSLKSNAGYNTSITDLWGRALSYHFAPGTTEDNFYDRDNNTSHGANLLFSNITDTAAWAAYALPFPIIVADTEYYNTTSTGNPLEVSPVDLNHTVYEINPYEFGSYDAYLSAFVNLTYLGTTLNAGSPANATGCTIGFDNFGFLIGTSSSLFNAIIEELQNLGSSWWDEVLEYISSKLTNGLTVHQDDFANYPNPFKGVSPETYPDTDQEQILLVDGGENGENVPLQPLLVKARGVDVILAMDSSADTDYAWPNGTSLLATYARTQLPILNGTVSFPPMPASQDDFVNNGWNTRPTFFGCNTTTADAYPLVVYIANSSPSGATYYQTNTTTLTLEYSIEDTTDFLNVVQENTFKGYPQDGQTRDSEWPNCLACALVDRTRKTAGIARSSECQTCFSRYCYDDGVQDI